MLDGVTKYLPWGASPHESAELVSVCDYEGLLGVALKTFGEEDEPEAEPQSLVESNRMILMRELGQEEKAYSNFWIFVRDSEKMEMSLEEMGGNGIIRMISSPVESSEDIIYMKICKVSDISHQVLLGLFEARTATSYVPLYSTGEEQSSWNLRVCVAPEGSRFIQGHSVPIIQDNVPSLSLSRYVNHSLYESEGLSNLTVRNMLTKLFNTEKIELDEVYCLWSRHFE